jgi:hypothetical protein
MPRNQLARLTLLLCLAFASFAQAADERGGYMGGALGTFDYSEPSEDNVLAVSDNTTQYQLFGGYRVSRLFAVEFALGRTQDLDTRTVINGPGGPTTLDISQYFDTYALKAVGFLPFDLTSLYANVGYYSATLNAEVNVPGIGTVLAGNAHFNGSTAGIGVQRDFRLDLKSLSVRGEYTWYDFEDGIDASGFTVGLLFRF